MSTRRRRQWNDNDITYNITTNRSLIENPDVEGCETPLPPPPPPPPIDNEDTGDTEDTDTDTDTETGDTDTGDDDGDGRDGGDSSREEMHQNKSNVATAYNYSECDSVVQPGISSNVCFILNFI